MVKIFLLLGVLIRNSARNMLVQPSFTISRRNGISGSAAREQSGLPFYHTRPQKFSAKYVVSTIREIIFQWNGIRGSAQEQSGHCNRKKLGGHDVLKWN